MKENVPAGKRLRLFVAIELPAEWLEALGGLQRRMQEVLSRDEALAGVRVRWTRPKGIHLTLKFIGEVTADRLEPIEAQLARAVPDAPGIELSLGRAGSFSDRRAPRVVWAGVETRQMEALLGLAASVETWLAAAGVPRERRPFAPHLTLARLPNELNDALRVRIASVTSGVEAPQVAPFEVEHVSLMRSILGPGGARYERVAWWPA